VISILYVGWPELIGKHPGWSGKQRLAAVLTRPAWMLSNHKYCNISNIYFGPEAFDYEIKELS
jgi:hypothetical protein